MEKLVINSIHDFYKNKRVLVTGHTGFKGSWLCTWLHTMGADVFGLALDPENCPSLFLDMRLGSLIDDCRLDIRDREGVSRRVKEVKPDVIFHLAAQPLVRESYRIPVETFETNVLGTVNLLDAIRLYNKACAIVVITTDKCYENREWVYAYRETDELGGHDPYSASKACAELVARSWHRSYFSKEGNVAMSTARAGNVIGGGDWAKDRIVPDCMRAFGRGDMVNIRNPQSIRPWQFVLEPLLGYLMLGAKLYKDLSCNFMNSSICGEAFNFGPQQNSNQNVRSLVKEIIKNWPGTYIEGEGSGDMHEAGFLQLSTHKAHNILNWSSIYGFAKTVEVTVNWYKSYLTAKSKSYGFVRNLTKNQLIEFENAVKG